MMSKFLRTYAAVKSEHTPPGMASLHPVWDCQCKSHLRPVKPWRHHQQCSAPNSSRPPGPVDIISGCQPFLPQVLMKSVLFDFRPFVSSKKAQYRVHGKGWSFPSTARETRQSSAAQSHNLAHLDTRLREPFRDAFGQGLCMTIGTSIHDQHLKVSTSLFSQLLLGPGFVPTPLGLGELPVAPK